MSEHTARLLDLLQTDFPLSPAPFADLATRLGLSETEVLDQVRRLKNDKIIRQIGPIFDTKSLGYESSLVAMKVAPEHLDAAAAVVSAHPGVSHNYCRNHEFNLWFTVAVPPDSHLGLAKTVDVLHELAGAESTRLLPTLKLFKIGVALDMSGDGDGAAREKPKFTGDDQRTDLPPLTAQDRRLIRITQRPLAVEARPFDAYAAEAGIAVDELIAWFRRMQAEGRMRRFAAVLHHRQAGFKANGMGVWAVPEERIEQVGQQMASFKAVSHCYHRPAYPDWPYSIFTMVHGRSEAECEQILAKMAEETGVSDWGVLYSTKEYKKVRLQYFTADLDAWEREHAAAA